MVPALALILLVTQSALGAAASAAAMWGAASGPLHLWMAGPFLVAAAVASLHGRERRALALAVGALSALQVALGIYLGSVGTRPLALTLAHAASACVLALLMVSLAAGMAPSRLRAAAPSA